MKFFIYFLCYTVFVEFTGAGLIYFRNIFYFKAIRALGINSNIWFNIFWLFGSVLIVAYYYHTLLKVKLNKKIIRFLVVFFVIGMCTHVIIYPHKFLTTHPPFYLISGLIVTVICIFLYFYEILKSNDILNIAHTFGFYVSTGILIWWLVITPVLFFDIYNTAADWPFANLKRLIFLCANIVMYTIFAFALLWCKPEDNQLQNRVD